MLISVHVPKTGGISFLEVLKGRYGDRLLLDYSDRPMARGTPGRVARTFASRWTASRRDLSGYQCIHGHFLPVKYRFLKERAFAIWFRDPVELAVSRYFYFKRHLKPDDLQFRSYIKRADLSLEEYARLGHFHNVYAKYLIGMRLEDFDFIGITENYAASLEIFCRMFGIQAAVNQERMNANPSKAGSHYEIAEELRRLILRNNKKDAEIYRKAVAINRTLQERYLGERHGRMARPVPATSRPTG